MYMCTISLIKLYNFRKIKYTSHTIACLAWFTSAFYHTCVENLLKGSAKNANWKTFFFHKLILPNVTYWNLTKLRIMYKKKQATYSEAYRTILLCFCLIYLLTEGVIQYFLKIYPLAKNVWAIHLNILKTGTWPD